jgi:hypothetical protein
VLLARFDGDGLPAENVLPAGHHRLLLEEDSMEVPLQLPSVGYQTSEMPAIEVPQARPLGMWVALGLGLLAAAAWVFLR